jgi:DNA-binding NtrC family response regulator
MIDLNQARGWIALDGGRNMQVKSISNGIQVLIVDDNLEMLETLKDILSEMDFNIAVADNGFKAIEMVQDGRFDAILMDIQMPGIDGIETLKRIKCIKPSAKIIMMTATFSDDIASEAWKEGATETMSKPLDIDHLENILERIGDTAGRYYYYT